MARLEKKLFRIGDEIAELDRKIAEVTHELSFHRSIAEDAQRDAVTGNYIDREEADLTTADVARFEKVLASLETKRGKLEARRLRLLDRLAR